MKKIIAFLLIFVSISFAQEVTSDSIKNIRQNFNTTNNKINQQQQLIDYLQKWLTHDADGYPYDPSTPSIGRHQFR